MSHETIAVIGASGFVGSTFVERMMRLHPATTLVPFIHSSGNAARLGRYGIPLRMADIMSPPSITEALRGCTAVVNCSRGGKDVLLRGFENLVEASLAAGVKRLVHVSSVAVYGDPPPGEVLETAATTPEPETYGANKLAQDTLAEAAVGRGLPTVVLCPPNISGPHSPFLLDIVATLRAGRFGLVDNGSHPVELVDVENLAHAIHLALDPNVTADGKRIFITDCHDTMWGDLVERLRPLADGATPLVTDAATARRLTAPSPAPKASLTASARRLLSSDVRDALREDPLFAKIESLGKRAVLSAAPVGLQKALRKRAAGDVVRKVRSGGPSYSLPLLKQQLRDVRYSRSRAASVLGYTPVMAFGDSTASFQAFYAEAFAWNTPWWDLIRELS